MFRSILLTVDLADGPSAARTAEAAFRLARADGAEIHVLTVQPTMGMAIVGAQFAPDFEEKALAEAHRQLDAWVTAHAPEDVPLTAHLAQGRIYDQVIRTADRLGCDLIVMGAHRPEFSDYLLGPNAARVVRHAAQSVLVIRAP